MLFALPLLLLGAHATAAEFKVLRPQQSSVSFVSRQMGVPVDGEFRKFTAGITVDPAKPEQGSARIDIDVGSIDTGNQEANDEVVGKDWFDAKAYPTATFVSTAVRSLEQGRYTALGKLTIKGKTLDTQADFTMDQKAGDLVILAGSFTLKRLAYGIGSGIWSDTDTVADEVLVRFRFVVAQK
jgi:polyisoprenoid-binding protein YceI